MERQKGCKWQYGDNKEQEQLTMGCKSVNDIENETLKCTQLTRFTRSQVNQPFFAHKMVLSVCDICNNLLEPFWLWNLL